LDKTNKTDNNSKLFNPIFSLNWQINYCNKPIIDSLWVGKYLKRTLD